MANRSLLSCLLHVRPSTNAATRFCLAWQSSTTQVAWSHLRSTRASFITITPSSIAFRKAPVSNISKFTQYQQDRRWIHGRAIDQAKPSPVADAETGPDLIDSIKVIDYSDTQMECRDIASDDLQSYLDRSEKPQWAACRWVFLNACEQASIEQLGRQKGFHSLTMEDILDPNTPTKVEWYRKYCYVSSTLHKLEYLDIGDHEHEHKHKHKQNDVLFHRGEAKGINASTHSRTKWQTISPGRFGVSTEKVSCLLTADNTVITIFERSGHDIFSSVLRRLETSDSILRTSNDPSMLLQAVIDTVVDLATPIGRAVSDTFAHLEQAVFSHPSIGQSQELYTLRSGLTHVIDDVVSMGIVVKMLSDHHDVPAPPSSPMRSVRARADLTHHVSDPNLLSETNTKPLISPLAQVYFRDVQDHINALLSSTRMAVRSAENLTSLIFNMIAASQNESVRQLTLVSSFFLPLTFLTGYFGMNFDPMPIVNDHSDAFFWLIATPVMLGTVLLLRKGRGSLLRGRRS